MLQPNTYLFSIFMIVSSLLEQTLVLCELVFCLLISHLEDVVGLLERLEFAYELLAVLVKLVVLLLSSVDGGLAFLQTRSECLVSAVVVLAHAFELFQLVLHQHHDFVTLADFLLAGSTWKIVFISQLCPHALEIPACILFHLLHFLLQ